jgi:Flp pilus assembly protein protease CpaA
LGYNGVMFQFLLDALDLWSDRPRKLKAWVYAGALAAVLVLASLILDRCAAADDAPPAASPAVPA